MTEMKYIFPKQLQSVAALAFIAVLIFLLLILNVMVHMRNRKLKSTLEEQMAERRLLDKICSDFTAVYMDIMMPRMNGLDAARTIREMKRRDAMRVPIIAISANAFAEDIINSWLAGMNVHLAKPLDAEKMIVALKQCMADNSDVKLHEDL